jgi:hypothetical protein
MQKILIKSIPQDSDWNKSFNVLVPLEIQGKGGILIKSAESPTCRKGSQSAIVWIDNKNYFIPSWAIIGIPEQNYCI